MCFTKPHPYLLCDSSMLEQQQEQQYQSRDILDSNTTTTKIAGEISFLQHNVGKRQEVQQTLLELAFAKRTDIVLVQEPSVWLDCRDNMWFSFPHPSYSLVLPKSDKRPRTAIYIRTEAAIQHKQREDLSKDSDLLILEISGPTERFLLLNIYNEKELAEDSTSQQGGVRTIERALLHLQLTNTPFLIAGDFNSHHFLWNTAIQNPNYEANQLASWLEAHRCELLNTEQEQTFFRSNLRSTSIIDLAFAAGFKENTWDTWYRAEDTGSDHITISFSCYTKHTEKFLSPLQERLYKLDKADWELFATTFKEQAASSNLMQMLEAINAKADKIELGNLLLSTQIQEDLDTATNLLTQSIQEAARKAIPKARHCERSKPWWSKELAEQRKQASKAIRLYQTYTTLTNARRAKAKRDQYLYAVKQAKANHWDTFLQKATGKDIFKALAYTKQKTTRAIPELKYKQGEEIRTAQDFKEQCTAFTTTLFSSPPRTNLRLDWKGYRQGNWEWPEELDEIEVYNAIFTSSPIKAPGTDKLSFAILRKAYNAESKLFYLLYRALFVAGYHPKAWREAIGVILPKANKKDYSLPKAYRVISLLNCLGKAFEKILATRLSYLAETGNLLQDTQIGGRKQKSALDACLLLQTKIQEAWKKKHTTALLFIDVKGAFDHVSANQLLAMCKKLQLPLALIRWISFFLSERSMQLKFNGQTQPLQRVKIGIPQGSPISPILFLLYIRDICKTRPDTFTFSYIDDICIGASAKSTKTLKQILENTATAVLREAKQSAIEFDVEKTELLYASRKREINAKPIQVGPTLIQPSSCVRWLGFFLDNKLSYKKHVQTKVAMAQQVFQRLQRLGNTQRGLSTQAIRQLYTACISSIADYGVQLWWGKQKNSLLREYQQLQNSALRQILGAFKGSPIKAMEIEAAILPINLRAEKLCQQYAIRTLSFAKRHPIRKAILRQKQLRIPTQLGELAKRIQNHDNIEEISILLAKPWSKPASAYATFTVSNRSKSETADQHKQWLQDLQANRARAPILLYTDGSKIGEEVAAGYCQVSIQGKYIQAKNLSLGSKIEIMDAELVAAYQALYNLQSQGLQGEDIYLFIDSQAALKRLQKVSLTAGQKICYEITELCRLLAQNNTVYISWVPGHREIQGNEHADRLAKAGLKRKARDPLTSLSYLKRKAKEDILAKWKQDWKDTRPAQKGKAYSKATRERPKISYQIQQLSGPKKVQSAYYQLKLGKGFFKQFSKAIGKDDTGQCFGNCSALQSPKHLLLHCRHYRKEREKLARVLDTPTLTLQQLFNTKKGSAALLGFLQDTEIATARWLLAAGAL
jgi:ribonuclease HI